MAGVNDLIAANPNLNCYNKFLRNVSRSRNIGKHESGAVLSWLIDELKKSAEQGHILELKEVWLCYCSLAAELNMDIPPSFRSRMTTFKEHIAPHIADIYDFVLLRDHAVGLPCTRACKCRRTKDVRCQNVANDDAVENEGQ